METASRFRLASRARDTACSSLLVALVEIAGLQPALDPVRVDLDAKCDAAVHVIASGCAPPMPPSPAVRVSVPANDPPNRCSAMAAKV